MSKVIIVCGLPGSGKTTLSRELSKRLGIVCLHKDSIKEKLTSFRAIRPWSIANRLDSMPSN
jgi:adenylate kinase family enzyme